MKTLLLPPPSLDTRPALLPQSLPSNTNVASLNQDVIFPFAVKPPATATAAVRLSEGGFTVSNWKRNLVSSACLMKSWECHPLRLTVDKVWKTGKSENAGGQKMQASFES